MKDKDEEMKGNSRVSFVIGKKFLKDLKKDNVFYAVVARPP